MAFGDIVPWRSSGLARTGERSARSLRDEMEQLHRSIDRMFEDAWNFGPSLLSETWTSRPLVPQLDATEDDKAFRVAIELPGMTDKDVAVSLAERVLTIRGEKKEEQERKDKNVHRKERAYGSFRRVIELPADVDADKIQAAFRNGVLTIDLPKTKEAQAKVKEIPVKAA